MLYLENHWVNFYPILYFLSRNLKVSLFSLEISRLINFVFSREHVSFVLKTMNIGK